MSSGDGLSLRVGDYRRVLVGALSVLRGSVALVTYTAPGEEFHGVPSTEAWRQQWNKSMPKRRKRLHEAIRRALIREGVKPPTIVAWVVQRQSRGLDHMHVVMWCLTPDHRESIARYVHHYRRLTECNVAGKEPNYSFGFMDDPFKIRKGGRDMVFASAEVCGKYLVRYLTESAQLAERIADRESRGRVMWVSKVLMARSGITMARLRRVRHAWWLREAISQGSRPRLPLWWGDMRERTSVLALLGPRVRAAEG